MIAFLRGEPGAEVVRNYIEDIDTDCMAHAINLCELFYDFHRSVDEAEALRALHDIEAIGVVERSDFDQAFWQEAGRHKAIEKRISLADCFALTLARRVGGSVLTSDHREFDSIATKGICPVIFFR